MGQVHNIWPGQVEDFHNAPSECMYDYIVYMYMYTPIPVEYLYTSAIQQFIIYGMGRTLDF